MKKEIEVTQSVGVTVRDDFFTPEFMEEFRRQFYPFETVDEHFEYLGQLFARGLVSNFTKFIEGYGDVKAAGIEFIEGSVGTEVYEGSG